MATAALGNRVIVVIGGTTGLGLAGAGACLAAGAKVIAVGRDTETSEAAAAELGADAYVITADATDPATAPAAIARALADFGRFDALYHVAGGSGRKQGDGPLDAISDEGWRYTLDLNLSSTAYSARAAVRQFLAQKTGGSVLLLGSVLASSPSSTFFATHAYAAAKAGLVGLARAAASYYAPQNIRFNVLAPGLVDTPMARRAVSDQGISRFIRSKQPLDGGRIGQPADLDAAVVYFLSEQSRFVTGQVLTIDGGWSVTEGRSGSKESGS